MLDNFLHSARNMLRKLLGMNINDEDYQGSSMLHNYLQATRNMLRRDLGPRGNGEEIVHISTPFQGIEKQKNYLGLMCIGFEQELAKTGNTQGFSLDAGVIVMLYADFIEYSEGLRFLSLGMQSFQENLILQPASFPDIPLSNPIYISPYFLPMEQQLQVWNPFANTPPSMLYKLRSLHFHTSQTVEPVVNAVKSGVRAT